jgi:hypothetical protein
MASFVDPSPLADPPMVRPAAHGACSPCDNSQLSGRQYLAAMVRIWRDTGRRPLRRGLLLLACSLSVVASVVIGPPRVAGASAIAQVHGFDACAAPSSASMDAWWPRTPFFNVGVYIGGANRTCPQPNLTRTWIAHQQSTGWGLLPIWVGPQMGNPSCTNKHVWNSNISTNATTAYNQGVAEAKAAYRAAATLGFAPADLPLVYDLEAYSGGSSSITTCRTAAKSFVKGWADYLQVPTAQESGVYASACGSYIDDFYGNGNPPDFIWFADWMGDPSTSSVTNGCIKATHWANNQRHKQYSGGHNETWNGVTFHVDSDCSNGPVYYGNDRLFSASDCL